MEKDEILIALQELVLERGYLHSAALMVLQDLLVNVRKLLEIDWRARISFREFSLLFGLMIRKELNYDVLSAEGIHDHIHRTHDLLGKLHESHNALFVEKMSRAVKEGQEGEEIGNAVGEILGSGEFMTEPIFYGGSGAYDFQFLDLAAKRYERDTEWLRINKGATINELKTVAYEVKSLIQNKVRRLYDCQSDEEVCAAAVSALSFREEELVSGTLEARKSFLTNFSLLPGTVNPQFFGPGIYNRFESHPIISIKDGQYFLPVWFVLTQSIYESPFYWMSEDVGYKDLSFGNRGEATEKMAYEMLGVACGANNVFRGVKVIRKKGETISDIDVLAVLRNKAIIVQAKSKKLTQLARRGNEKQLRTDFAEGIQLAYEQGLACRKALLEGNVELSSATGEKFVLSESIDEAYLVCLTSDEYPAVLHQVDAYLTKEASDPLPIAISIFDLEILTFYLCDPFDLFYYIRQRVELGSYFKGGIEMSLLGYHLTHKLFKIEGSNWVGVDETFAQLIDANYPAVRGHQPRTDSTDTIKNRWRNQRFESLLTQVKKADTRRLTDAVFVLLDLSGEGADLLMEAIRKTIQKTRASGKIESVWLIPDRGMPGLSFVAKICDPSEIERHTLTYAMVRKYRMRNDCWLGLGSTGGDENIVDSVIYLKNHWKEDATLEEVAKTVLPRPGIVLDKKMRRLGRNDPCYCGSGKKYKKCHGK